MRYVALHTGLKPYLIRTWEERYSAVCPRRSPSNRRLYTDQDVRRLMLLKKAVDCGHNISSVAPLSDRDLMRLLERAEPLAESASRRPQESGSQHFSPEESNRPIVEEALACIEQLDARGLENLLNEAAVDMPRQSFLQSVIVPLFARIGDLWRDGKLKTINEHMASVIVRSMLWDMLRTIEVAEPAPRIVVATPSGHWHEFGALAAALAASESGWQPLYFGPNLPAEEIAYAVRKLEARALCLSLCHRHSDRRVFIEIGKIRRTISPHVPVFLGGPGADMVGSQANVDVVIVSDLFAFRDKLEKLMIKKPTSSANQPDSGN